MANHVLKDTYYLCKIIGNGIYGEVWLAKDKNGNKYAIKIQNKKEEDCESIARKEIEYLEMVKSNNNFVKIIENFEDNDYIYIVLEYYEKTIRILISDINNYGLQKKLSFIQKWSYQILKGINFLNGLGFGHFDIKPENILIDKNNDIKICDLGLSDKPENIKKNQECQSVYYRSPEAIETHLNNCKPKLDFKSDVWSVGCIMAEIIMGFPLFYQITSKTLLKQQLEGAIIRYNRKVYPIIFNELNIIGMNYVKVNELFGADGTYVKFIKILEKCLKHDINERISVETALNHPFFI